MKAPPRAGRAKRAAEPRRLPVPRVFELVLRYCIEAVALRSSDAGEMMMWRPLLLCTLGLLCLAGFRHAYRPPALPGCTLVNARMASAHLPGVDFRQVDLSG